VASTVPGLRPSFPQDQRDFRGTRQALRGPRQRPAHSLFLLLFRFAILSTSFIIPLDLMTVQNYRAMEIGGVLVWIALPQLLLAPVVATTLRFVDARLPMAFGFALVGCACFMAGQLTHDWAGAGGGPVPSADLVGLVRLEAPGAEGDYHLRRDAADCAPVRGGRPSARRTDRSQGIADTIVQ
jgi:hypothetical protein